MCVNYNKDLNYKTRDFVVREEKKKNSKYGEKLEEMILRGVYKRMGGAGGGGTHVSYVQIEKKSRLTGCRATRVEENSFL